MKFNSGRFGEGRMMAPMVALASIAFAIVGGASVTPLGGVATIVVAVLLANAAVAGLALWRGRAAWSAAARSKTTRALPPGVVWC